MVEKKQEWELLPGWWIEAIRSFIQGKKLLGPEKKQELLQGSNPMSCKGQVQKIKAWLKTQRILPEDQKKGLSQKKDNIPVEAPKAPESAKIRKESPKDQPEGKEKGKRKWKFQMEPNLFPKLQHSKESKDSHGKCVQYGKNLHGVQKQGGGKNE
ncbi:hypothetical protein O181_065067 [Austropuccinia psidii MF-1]|uniref:Uncharacterized protein n=1 Tax=Austropuccinia psidii MF-1 TaxID=1389203 RepID=A0A9Q3EST9_9BASI|nr:hypothetical protein [Austropuccinia psidii MF-1]